MTKIKSNLNEEIEEIIQEVKKFADKRLTLKHKKILDKIIKQLQEVKA